MACSHGVRQAMFEVRSMVDYCDYFLLHVMLISHRKAAWVTARFICPLNMIKGKLKVRILKEIKQLFVFLCS